MAEPDVDMDWDGVVDPATRLRMWLGLTGPHTGSTRLVAAGVVMLVLVAGYPMAEYLFLTPAPARSPLIGTAQQMSKLNYRIVMSNVPETLSWYGGQSTVGVPASGLQLTAMREAGIVPDAIFLSPTPAAMQIQFAGYRRVQREGIRGLLWEPAPPGTEEPEGEPAAEGAPAETEGAPAETEDAPAGTEDAPAETEGEPVMEGALAAPGNETAPERGPSRPGREPAGGSDE